MTDPKSTSITRRTALKTVAGAATVVGGSGIAGAEFRQEETDEDNGQACDFNGVFEDAIDSVVTIRVFDTQDAEFATGSGWVYDLEDSSAVVVTNWHVVALAAGADVRFSDGDWRSADEPLGFDPYSDLAVFRVEDVPEYVEALSVVDTPPEQGEQVAALGSPLGLEETITTGTVSAVERSTPVQFEEFQYTVPSTIQTDAATNPGNSGGPLVDCDGEVVGVNFAGTAPTVAENVNFAISSSMVERVVPEIVETGTFRHPYMGLQAITISPTISRQNGIDETTEGIYVERTVTGFPADELLQGTTSVDRETGVPLGGDVIQAVDGTEIDDVDALRNYLFEEASPEETITLTILRDGSEEEIELPLVAKPLQLERIGVREPTI